MATLDFNDDFETNGAGDPRYSAVLNKRFNKRLSGRPDYVRLANSTEQVIAAVQHATNEGRCLVDTSGGDCLEGFVPQTGRPCGSPLAHPRGVAQISRWTFCTFSREFSSFARHGIADGQRR
jgi:hypothetical protein